MNGLISMDQVFLNKLTETVVAHIIDDKFGIEQLSKEVGMSRSNLNRKLRSIKKQDAVTSSLFQ